MKSFLFTLCICLACSFTIHAQEAKREVPRPVMFYAGIQPLITAEPFDEFRQTVDINTLPFIFEYAVDRRWSVRITPILNIQLRPEFPTVISHLGGGITVPYHFSKKNSEEGHRGFFAGPNLAYTQHQVDGFNSTTIAAEIGYAFLLNRSLSITIGVQAGQTFMFLKELGYNRIAPHTGALFSFGYWF